MNKKTPAITIFIAIVLFVTYIAGYIFLPERYSGRARNADAFFHYRIFNHRWEAYLYIPAGWAESLIIRSYPEPFLPNPSWAKESQILFIQFPEGNIRFGNPPNP
jgi:hypothetical protein